MASRGPQPSAGVPRAPVSRRCSTQLHCKDAGGGSRRAKARAVADDPSCLPRNVLSERRRRRRISVSCEQLRALLPQFSGRREDMASVLEMSVQFLRFAGTVVPGGQQHAVPAPSKDVWQQWQKDILQLALARQTPAGAPDAGTGAGVAMLVSLPAGDPQGLRMQTAQSPLSSLHQPSRPQDPPSFATSGVEQGEAPAGAAEVLDRPAALPGPSSPVPETPGPSPPGVPRPPPAWPPCSEQPTSPLVSREAQSCLGQAGPRSEGADQAVTPGTRSVSGCDVEEWLSSLLTSSPDWWLGSLEGADGGTVSQAAARSSPPDRAEPGSSQDLLDCALEPWGWDVGCSGLSLPDETGSILSDFFAV